MKYQKMLSRIQRTVRRTRTASYYPKIYLVVFLPTLKDAVQVKKVLDALGRADDTFTYEEQGNILFFEDVDKKRAFRRGMWVKRALEKRGIDLDFTFSKYPLRPREEGETT